MKTKPHFATALAVAVLLSTSAPGQVVFSESFESPVVVGFDDNTVPDNGNWIGATNGFGSSNRGLYNETVAWPATPPFTTPYGDQAYLLNYTNSALTTSQGATGENLTADVTYTVAFHVGLEQGTASANYLVELVAFDPSHDNNSRKDGQGGRVGTVLASASGSATTTEMSETGQIVFTPDGSDPSLGKEVGLRLVKASGTMLYDNIRLITGHDLNPSPADGEDLDAGGSVTLGWTNMPPNAPATDTPVDVWFGSDSSALVQEVDGQITSSTIVSAPSAGTWSWRVDSYPDGDPNGTPVTGDVFSFTINDTDGDGLPDDYELANTDPSSNTALDPASDLDSDNLTAADEYNYGTDPNDDDTDDDTLLDGPELVGVGERPATSPVDADSDDDGLSDGVESNTGTWMGAADTGTNPTDPDWDDDGIKDGAETNTDTYVDRFDTGSDPYNSDSDADGAGDWYEANATFTDPNSNTETPSVPYPLPDPDGSTGNATAPVKVYIMAGQSNTVGIGYIDDPDPGSLASITRQDNKFPNLIDSSDNWTERNDVIYRGVVTANGNNGPLTAYQGADGSRVGPELGFGHVMGWFHDEPVLIIKASQGNRSLGWDFCPPDSAQYVVGADTYAGYGDTPAKWPTGTTPVPVNWYAGKQYDECFRNETDWGAPGFDPVTNAYDVLGSGVLQNLPTDGDDLNGRNYEIAGFVWWQGHKDHTDGVYAPRYEQNLVNLIHKMRADFNAPTAPFVVATIGFGGGDIAAKPALYQAVYNAQKNIADHPDFAGSGTVKSVDTLPYWRELDESPGGQDFHYNNNAETYTLVGDAMARAMLSLQNDVSPPTPSPMTFEIVPTAVDTTTVGMVATTASDPSGPVEYWFENIDAATNSGWITSTRWDSTGLSNGTSYDFRVKARDTEGNETDWSSPVSAAPGNDGTGPTPDPMSFATPPTAQGENAVTMTATTASDINGVEYEFVNTAGGGNSSGWQDSPVYTDTGLNPGTEYTYQVRARDKSSSQNPTAFSSTASATTDTPDTTAPTPNPMTFNVPPAASGETTITMTADTATDPSGVEYRFNNVTLGTDSGWQDGTSYEATGLSPDTEYTFTVQARDKSPAQTATAASDPASANTDAPDTTPPSVETYSPVQDATNVPVNSDLIVTFDENVVLGSGLITIKKISDGTTTTIDVTDGSQVSVSGGVLTINPSTSLEIDTIYAVLIADTAVDDLVGNSFPGISNDTVWRFTTAPPPPVGLAFSDDFETPDVTIAESGGGGTNGTSNKVDTSKWVRATQGHGAKANGIEDEGAGDFTDPVGEQAYAFRYTNSGVTTAPGVIGALASGQIITVSFDVVLDGYNSGDAWTAKLVAFNEGAARNDVRNNTGSVVLKEVSGDATSTNYGRVSFDYTVDAVEDAPHFGKDIALRFRGATTSATIDNVSVTSTGTGPGPVDKFAISAIASPQTVGSPITGITITAQDASDATATDFTGTVTFGGTGGFSGTSANFVDGVLSGVSVTPTLAGSDLTFTVDDGSGHTGSTTIALIDPAESAYETWSGGLDFETDTSGDGVANGLAFALGAADPQANAVDLLPAGGTEPGFLTLQFQRAGDLGDALLYAEHGNDLGGWTQLLIPAASTTDPHLADGVQVVVVPGGSTDTVTVKIPTTLESASGTLFGRLRVTEN